MSWDLRPVRREPPGEPRARRVRGARRAQAAFSNDLRWLAPGRAQYTHLLDAADGSVVDNIIVWWLAEERFWVLPNASNNEAVVAATVVALPFVRG